MQYLLHPISFCFPSLNSIISPVKMLQLELCRIRYSEDLQTPCDSASLTPRNQDLSKNSLSASVQFSRSVVSDSLWPCGLQHSRPPCPPPTPRAHSDSCPFCCSLNRLSWWLSGKGSACQCRRQGRSPGEGNGNPSSILAWEIPWTKKPRGQQSLGLQRVRHHWMTKL